MELYNLQPCRNWCSKEAIKEAILGEIPNDYHAAYDFMIEQKKVRIN
jgi:hypothetical protein